MSSKGVTSGKNRFPLAKDVAKQLRPYLDEFPHKAIEDVLDCLSLGDCVKILHYIAVRFCHYHNDISEAAKHFKEL